MPPADPVAGSQRATMSSYLSESRRWDTAVLLVVPLLVFYELGLLVFVTMPNIRG